MQQEQMNVPRAGGVPVIIVSTKLAMVLLLGAEAVRRNTAT
jgi:hypothetical protein